ncbi:MAG: 1-acyl-sn-glycerol-3-phosphate acyltransferase [bacterium]
MGSFSGGMYQVATRIVPVTLNLLLNSLSPLKLAREIPSGFSHLDDQIVIEGSSDLLPVLAEKSTLVVVPTHCSNLDSVLIGYVLYRLGLPPFLYGAGLNLFSNKLIGFFMNHLGAYKVDRLKKAPLYKEVLKTYAGYSMELGYHNLFFPGGTRSRSGAVESKLKLGLLGMGLNAYIHNLLNQKKDPDIFIVPCTFNYQLVLEAETLIEDYLKEAGKSRYIIEDDEFSQVRRIFQFVNGLFSLQSRIHVVFSTPLDVFGNPVDENGISRDPRGRPVERRRYVLKNGEAAFDRQRDHEFTHELSEKIVEAYHRDTVVSSVQLVCRVVFDWLRKSNPALDLYRLLRTGGRVPSMRLVEVYEAVDRTLETLRGIEKAGRIRLDESLHELDTVGLLSEALAHLQNYHLHSVLERKGDRLFHEDRNLIFYYQNRLPVLEREA